MSQKRTEYTEEEFNAWCDELDKIAREEFEFECDCTISTGRECWRDAFEDGETPRDALLEDLSYA